MDNSFINRIADGWEPKTKHNKKSIKSHKDDWNWFFKDTDKDGVMNGIDCEPYNKNKQDTPTILQSTSSAFFKPTTSPGMITSGPNQNVSMAPPKITTQFPDTKKLLVKPIVPVQSVSVQAKPIQSVSQPSMIQKINYFNTPTQSFFKPQISVAPNQSIFKSQQMSMAPVQSMSKPTLTAASPIQPVSKPLIIQSTQQMSMAPSTNYFNTIKSPFSAYLRQPQMSVAPTQPTVYTTPDGSYLGPKQTQMSIAPKPSISPPVQYSSTKLSPETLITLKNIPSQSMATSSFPTVNAQNFRLPTDTRSSSLPDLRTNEEKLQASRQALAGQLQSTAIAGSVLASPFILPVFGGMASAPVVLGAASAVEGATLGGLSSVADTGKINPETIVKDAALGGVIGGALGYIPGKVTGLITSAVAKSAQKVEKLAPSELNALGEKIYTYKNMQYLNYNPAFNTGKAMSSERGVFSSGYGGQVRLNDLFNTNINKTLSPAQIQTLKHENLHRSVLDLLQSEWRTGTKTNNVNQVITALKNNNIKINVGDNVQRSVPSAIKTLITDYKYTPENVKEELVVRYLTNVDETKTTSINPIIQKILKNYDTVKFNKILTMNQELDIVDLPPLERLIARKAITSRVNSSELPQKMKNIYEKVSKENILNEALDNTPSPLTYNPNPITAPIQSTNISKKPLAIPFVPGIKKNIYGLAVSFDEVLTPSEKGIFTTGMGAETLGIIELNKSKQTPLVPAQTEISKPILTSSTPVESKPKSYLELFSSNVPKDTTVGIPKNTLPSGILNREGYIKLNVDSEGWITNKEKDLVAEKSKDYLTAQQYKTEYVKNVPIFKEAGGLANPFTKTVSIQSSTEGNKPGTLIHETSHVQDFSNPVQLVTDTLGITPGFKPAQQAYNEGKLTEVNGPLYSWIPKQLLGTEMKAYYLDKYYRGELPRNEMVDSFEKQLGVPQQMDMTPQNIIGIGNIYGKVSQNVVQSQMIEQANARPSSNIISTEKTIPTYNPLGTTGGAKTINLPKLIEANQVYGTEGRYFIKSADNYAYDLKGNRVDMNTGELYGLK